MSKMDIFQHNNVPFEHIETHNYQPHNNVSRRNILKESLPFIKSVPCVHFDVYILLVSRHYRLGYSLRGIYSRSYLNIICLSENAYNSIDDFKDTSL